MISYLISIRSGDLVWPFELVTTAPRVPVRGDFVELYEGSDHAVQVNRVDLPVVGHRPVRVLLGTYGLHSDEVEEVLDKMTEAGWSQEGLVREPTRSVRPARGDTAQEPRP